MLFGIDQVVKNPESIPTALQWAQFVAVPIVIAVLGVIAAKLNTRMKSAEKNAADAAFSTRTNGSGHPTQTSMIEDVLMILGEIKGDIKDIDGDVHRLEGELKSLDSEVKEHIKSPVHFIWTGALSRMEDSLVELKDLVNVYLGLKENGR